MWSPYIIEGRSSRNWYAFGRKIYDLERARHHLLMTRMAHPEIPWRLSRFFDGRWEPLDITDDEFYRLIRGELTRIRQYDFFAKPNNKKGKNK